MGTKTALHPFPINWRDNDRSMFDFSSLIETPAGRDGHVRIKNGHLYTPAGRRLRIWGVNLTGAACYPNQRDAPAMAAHLARLGINCVRFHFLDSGWRPRATIFPSKGNSTRRLDPAQLARLDRLVWELKLRGIYSDFNLNVGRLYRSGDGVAEHEYLGLGKVLQYFDDHIAGLHREYATRLLTHRNPHTKTRYVHEPALLVVELLNENSIFESWFWGLLRGRQTEKNSGQLSDLTAGYAGQLTARYNRWLADRYPAAVLRRWRRQAGVAPDGPVPRLDPQEFKEQHDPLADLEPVQFKGAAPDRFAAEAEFYLELERRYFKNMRSHLKKIGLRALVVGNSDHFHPKTGYPQVSSTSRLDMVDSHVYWQHPEFAHDRKKKKRGFSIENSPMVNDPLNSTVVQLSRTPVAGKPFTVSEVNHPFPSEYACEGIPILAAYGSLQDWDGIFMYSFAHAPAHRWSGDAGGFFDLHSDPVKTAQLAGCTALFLRGDVAPAKRTILRSYSKQQVINSLRLSTPREFPFFTPGFSPAFPLVHATRAASFNRKKTAYPKLKKQREIVSDTGELTWQHRNKKGLVTIATDRSEALVGFLGGSSKQAGRMSARVSTPFCSLVLTSLDGKPLAHSERMLLVAGARTATTGMRWHRNRHTLTRRGKAPMRIELVKGTVSLGRKPDAARLEIIALNDAGAPLRKPSPAPYKGGRAHLPLTAPTMWYLVKGIDRI